VGLAFSDSDIRRATIVASPPATFIANLDAILLDVGWTKLDDYENGFLYQLQSPQSLLARCRIWFPDDGAWPNCLALQMLSAADPDVVGTVHHFVAGYTAEFEGDTRAFGLYVVWADVCQLFIGASHTSSWQTIPRAVACGIPHAYGSVMATEQCSKQTPPPPEITNELWWSAGDDFGTYQDLGSAANFRNSYFCQHSSFCHNLELENQHFTSATIPAETPSLQLGIVRSAINWNVGQNDWPSGFIWPDGAPLANNPLVIHQGKIYGQLWDAVLVSRPMALEASEQIYESDYDRTTSWHNYSRSRSIQISTFDSRDEGKCSSLLLLDEQPAPPVEIETGNIAY
jgi:hypothetical protein